MMLELPVTQKLFPNASVPFLSMQMWVPLPSVTVPPIIKLPFTSQIVLEFAMSRAPIFGSPIFIIPGWTGTEITILPFAL
jgi:hypothetical protein